MALDDDGDFEAPAPTSAATAAAATGAGRPKRGVPSEDLPRLVRLVHGKTWGMAKLVSAFLDASADGGGAPAKAQVKAQITALATYAKVPGGTGNCWQVSLSKLEELGLGDITLDSLTPPRAAAAPPPAAAAAPAPAAPPAAAASGARCYSCALLRCCALLRPLLRPQRRPARRASCEKEVKNALPS